uniref:Uncharacterized protein n=1 Tax=viral metagenome TaxID=1070528 RepID=A0A6M3JFL6_9ZZZZ
MFNYCYDKCPNNTIPRRSYQDGKEKITEATEGKNKQLLCSIGYKQTVNSVEGRVNSEKNGTIIYGRLRTIFKA